MLYIFQAYSLLFDALNLFLLFLLHNTHFSFSSFFFFRLLTIFIFAHSRMIRMLVHDCSGHSPRVRGKYRISIWLGKFHKWPKMTWKFMKQLACMCMRTRYSRVNVEKSFRFGNFKADISGNITEPYKCIDCVFGVVLRYRIQVSIAICCTCYTCRYLCDLYSIWFLWNLFFGQNFESR